MWKTVEGTKKEIRLLSLAMALVAVTTLGAFADIEEEDKDRVSGRQ